MTKTHLFASGNKHKIYQIWLKMRQRCNNVNDPKFKDYGGRGIKVCERWNNFQNFRDDMLETWFIGASIERINNDGNYEPSNCKWIPIKEQAKNRRNNNRIELNSIIKIKADWAREYGINRTTLNYRLSKGMSFSEALKKPITKRPTHCKLGHLKVKPGKKWLCRICLNSYQRKRWKLRKDTLINNQ